MDGRTEIQTDTELWHSNLIYRTLHKVICKISAQYVKARRRKVQKTMYYKYASFQKVLPQKLMQIKDTGTWSEVR